MARSKKDVDFWWKSLEAERFDQSWKSYKPSYEPLVATRVVVKERDNKFRDELFYHAGRFAEGARDDAAVNNHKIAVRLMKGIK